MAVNHSRSQRRDLLEGMTDGKYRKARPDTEVVPGAGNEETLHDRSTLHAPMNYGYATQELPLQSRSFPGI